MENSQSPMLLLAAKRKEAVVRDENRMTTAKRRAQQYYCSFVLVCEEADTIVLCADAVATAGNALCHDSNSAADIYESNNIKK